MGLVKAVIVMVFIQIVQAGVSVFYKLGADDGMSLRIIIAYRCIFSTAFNLPLALFLERGRRPKLTWMVLFQAFLCAVFGISLSQNLYLDSLMLTSATFASTLYNLTPAVTFILTVSFRIERVNFGKAAGKAKVMGVVIAVGGALILNFYKGVEIEIWPMHICLLRQHNNDMASHAHHLFGCLAALASCLFFSLWLIIQAKMSERYPCNYSSAVLVSLMGGIQNVVYALCAESDRTQWKLGWNIRLLTVAFTGIVGSGVVLVLMAWCLRKRGALFVSAFSPLQLVLVALAGSLLLNETLHLGNVLAAALIVMGLYLVLWGNATEKKKKKIINEIDPTKSLRGPQSSLDIVVTSPGDSKTHNKLNDTTEV